jgi:perosamine synthetase
LVHTYGHPADIDPIREIAGKRGIPVIEDAAEAHGASYKGRGVGGLADAAAFSLYANKLLTTGEGGIITTNHPGLAKLCRTLRDHAFSEERHFWHKYVGFNYRMTALQAALGVAQLERLGDYALSRRNHAARYRELLSEVPGLTLAGERHDVKSAFWMFGLLLQDGAPCTRDQLRYELAARGIETRTFFVPIHLQPIYYSQYSHLRFPVAERLCKSGLYLPSSSSLTGEEIEYVARCVREIICSRSARASELVV